MKSGATDAKTRERLLIFHDSFRDLFGHFSVQCILSVSLPPTTALTVSVA